MESYVRIGGRDLKNLTYAYMGVGVKNCHNHAYVINEWSLLTQNKMLLESLSAKGIEPPGFFINHRVI